MEQLTLDFGMSSYQFNKPIRLIELFAGIGTQAMALKRLGAVFEHYGMVEFDKYCLMSYNAIHGTSFTTTDVREVKSLKIKDTDKYDYIVTYSFPCTDLSLAGKGKGMVKGDSTRSGLLWEVERLLDVSEELPRVLLMENVPQILSVKHKPQFNEWQNFLARKGYTNHVMQMNAKDYGVAQNRDRVFMLSILGDYDYEHPKKMKLEKRLKDYLEDDVDEKYYMNDKMINYFNGQSNGWQRQFRPLTLENEHSWTITAREGNVAESSYIQIPEATKQGYALAKDGDGVYINRPHQKRGVVQDGMIQTIKTSGDDLGVVSHNLRIRKLTPLEVWRLMGISDLDFYKAQDAGVSNSQLYKQAGNAIVVNVLVEIFRNLLKGGIT